MAGELEEVVPDLPKGTVTERFILVMEVKLKLLAPHLDLIRSLMSAALDPTHRLPHIGSPFWDLPQIESDGEFKEYFRLLCLVPATLHPQSTHRDWLDSYTPFT
jgi:hypothetical protein